MAADQPQLVAVRKGLTRDIITFNRDKNGVVTLNGNPFAGLFSHPAVATSGDGIQLAVQDRDIVRDFAVTGTGFDYQVAGADHRSGGVGCRIL